MPRPVIAVINASTKIKDSDVIPVVAAEQTQLERDFFPAWGLSATLVIIKPGQKPPKGAWWAVLMDNSDVQGALGYHADTTPDDMPIAKIFVGTDIDAGVPWSTTFSHEILEMVLNPNCNRTAQDVNGVFYALEAADAVENDSYKFMVGNTAVDLSNFVLQPYFDPNAPSGSKYDFLGKLKAPFTLDAGGYTSVFDPNNPAAGWTMITADKSPATLVASRAPIGSRRDRIRRKRDQWILGSSLAAHPA